MTGSGTVTDSQSPAQIAATRTYNTAKELRVAADSLVRTDNRIRARQAFDGGTLGPQDQQWEFRELQKLDASGALAWVESTSASYGKSPGFRKACRQATRSILSWLLNFPGETWDERWFASGLDEAPRTGLDELSKRLRLRRQLISLGMTSLVRARLVRPSYEWLFSAQQWQNSRGAVTFLDVAEPEQTARMRALPQYRAAHELVRRNAENAIARILVRTG
ncbi:hypothetical protein AB4Y88_18070, partial [Paenarthrobacter sp. RAF9]